LWNDLGPAIKTGDIDKYVLQSDNPKIWNEASRFFFHLKSRNLRPVVLVVYEREAYFSKFDPSFRVSIDKNIRSLAFPKVEDLFEDSGLEAGFYKDFVLEVKFSGAIPAWMKDILFKYKLTRQSVSKYKLSLDHNKIFTTKHWLQVYNMGL
jgi:hypothetical protein